MLGFQGLVSRLCITSDIELNKKKGKFGQAQEKLAERVEYSEELEMSWRRAFTDVFLTQYEGCESAKDGIGVEKWSFLASGVPIIQGYSAGERAEMLTQFWNEVREQAL